MKGKGSTTAGGENYETRQNLKRKKKRSAPLTVMGTGVVNAEKRNGSAQKSDGRGKGSIQRRGGSDIKGGWVPCTGSRWPLKSRKIEKND